MKFINSVLLIDHQSGVPGETFSPDADDINARTGISPGGHHELNPPVPGYSYQICTNQISGHIVHRDLNLFFRPEGGKGYRYGAIARGIGKDVDHPERAPCGTERAAGRKVQVLRQGLVNEDRRGIQKEG